MAFTSRGRVNTSPWSATRRFDSGRSGADGSAFGAGVVTGRAVYGRGGAVSSVPGPPAAPAGRANRCGPRDRTGDSPAPGFHPTV